MSAQFLWENQCLELLIKEAVEHTEFALQELNQRENEFMLQRMLFIHQTVDQKVGYLL